MRKAILLVGLAAGYVLGTRDGRKRYEQMKAEAIRLWQDPRVQEKVGQAQDLANEKAPQMQEKVSQVAQKVSSATGDKKGRSRRSDSSSVFVPSPSTTSPVNPAPTSPTSPQAPVNTPTAGRGDGHG